jgi:Spy/CpxP family protein refolding chaperone
MKTMTSPRWTRFTQHLLAGGLLVALAGTALQAQAQPGPMGGSHRQGGTMAGAMGGPTGGVMGGMMGGPRAERMLEALGASAEQRVQVRQIMEAARTDQQARHEAGRSLHEQMRLAFVQPTVDANVIEALLLIDDDLRLTDMVGDYLRRNGYEVDTAPTLAAGRERLAKAATTRCCWT